MDEPVRVMTWNVWGRFGPWEQRQAAIAETLKEAAPDIVCLQEAFAVPDHDQLAELSSALRSGHTDPGSWDYAKASIYAKDDRWMGNAVLSRWPILASTTHVLPTAQGTASHRSALHAVIDTPFGKIDVISTHLDHRFDASLTRQSQIAELGRIVANLRTGEAAESYPVIVGADLNAVPDSDEVRSLTGRREPSAAGVVFTDTWEVAGDASPGHTWCDSNRYNKDSFWPRRRLDYLLISWPRPSSKGKPITCRVVKGEAVGGVHPSDHYAVVADLRRA